MARPNLSISIELTWKQREREREGRKEGGREGGREKEKERESQVVWLKVTQVL